jgi:hypothetical protein
MAAFAKSWGPARSMRNLWRVHCVFQVEPSTSDSLLVVPRPRPFFAVRAGFLVCANDEPQRHSLMEKDYLVLKRASASRPSGEWNDDDYDVLADGAVVGRIFKANAAPVGMAWLWTLAFGYHEDRTPAHGYAETRETAMAAFAKSWRRE